MSEGLFGGWVGEKGSTATPGVAGPLACSDNLISSNLSVSAQKTCFAHDITIANGIGITVEDTGELLVV